MKFINVISLATLAYASTASAAYGTGYGSSDGSSALPATGDSESSDSSSPSAGDSSSSGGGSNTPSGGSSSPAAGSSDFQPAVSCRNDICYSAVVPSATARSGSGPIWFQIYAPTKFSWVGMGTGSSMSDSNMFLIYQDGNGNVTLSHRQASGHTMPTVPSDSSVTTTLLAGSGVSDGFMVANFRCDNCTTWKRTESLTLTSDGTPMIGAWSEGESLDSTDVDESISKHTGQVRMFSFDLSAAQKSTAGNPFVGNFSVPEEIASGGANNTDSGDDGDDEGAGAGQFTLLSGSVAVAAIMTSLSLYDFLLDVIGQSTSKPVTSASSTATETAHISTSLAPSPYQVDMLSSSLSLIPQNIVSPAEERNIALYFDRHPAELVIGDEFVPEMNANTLLLLQQDPATVANVLAAIGYVYQVKGIEGSDDAILARRSRILADLRLIKPSSSYFEMALHLLLALCAMELVTFARLGQASSIPILLEHVASLINHHLSLGGNVSFVSRYLLRGLARQDLIVSMVNLRRFRVPTHVWLNYDEVAKPDRLLGYTATLMPIMEDLCALAEELRHLILPSHHDENSPELTIEPVDYENLVQRAESLRQRLRSWEPPTMNSTSFRSGRKFQAQAASYRAGGLLYLRQLMQHSLERNEVPSVYGLPNGPAQLDFQPSSDTTDFTAELAQFQLTPFTDMNFDFDKQSKTDTDPDPEALQRAHEILFYAAGLPAADVKLLLWPVFLAACQMKEEGDRAAVLDIFASILDRRKTVTVLKTRAFVKDVVWRARDEGKPWNWMTLAQEHPGECLPI
ncbi:cytochrome domain of cellobiose dehydrogenase domain-containing protein [Sarocladium implicatum]|nr:cytochrome domain of cellobiose dehydrogenase domain-containing protein [Sarocladium implicatum]